MLWAEHEPIRWYAKDQPKFMGLTGSISGTASRSSSIVGTRVAGLGGRRMTSSAEDAARGAHDAHQRVRPHSGPDPEVGRLSSGGTVESFCKRLNPSENLRPSPRGLAPHGRWLIGAGGLRREQARGCVEVPMTGGHGFSQTVADGSREGHKVEGVSGNRCG